MELVDVPRRPRCRHLYPAGTETGGPSRCARYLVGCDGAKHRAPRAGIPFKGGAYPQTFALADLEAEPLDRDAAHLPGRGGHRVFFPLGRPASWRMLAMHPSLQDGEAGTARWRSSRYWPTL